MKIDPRNLSDPQLVYGCTTNIIAHTTLTPEFVMEISRRQTGGDPSKTESQDRGMNPERLIEFAGRICYESFGTGRSSKDFHAHLAEVGHGSVLEHVSFSFLISGVSRALTLELVRHRVGVAISQRSTRFVDESSARLVVPPLLWVLESDDDFHAAFKVQAQQDLLLIYRTSCGIYAKVLDLSAQSLGMRRKPARGVARSVLSTNTETELVWTCNLRTLLNVARQRANEAADLEIRLLAVQLLQSVIALVPSYFCNCVQIQVGADGFPFATVRSF